MKLKSILIGDIKRTSPLYWSIWIAVAAFIALAGGLGPNR